jgi:dTMP kinase
MAERAGIFIAIEGTDGSGKTTHFELLADKLRTAGYEVATFDFPQYDKPSSYFVKRYLGGAYGSADQVGPYTGSLFYSLDRYEAAPLIRQALAEGKIVISNRFAGSNMAHQGTKFANAEERRGFFIWLDNLEFQMLGIPRPDINLVLRVPADVSLRLLKDKDQPAYLGNKQDIHESDLSHLERSVEVYDDLCNLFPKDFSRIDCVRGGELLPIEAVHKLVWEKLAPLLPRPRKRKSMKLAAAESQDDQSREYVQELPSGTIITNAGHDVLDQALIGSDSGLSVFTDHLPQTVIAQVMASLPETEQELDVLLLETLAGKADAAAQSREFIYERFALEEASQLLLQQINSLGIGLRIAEQSIAAADHGQRDKHGRYRYFVPPELDSDTKTIYCDIMDRIFATYGQLVDVLTGLQTDEADKKTTARHARQIASAVLPIAATSAVTFAAAGGKLERLIGGLETSEIAEARALGAGLLEQASPLMPGLKEELRAKIGNTEDPESPDLKTAIRQMLPVDYDASPSNAVVLSDVWPRNELDLVPDMLYAQAGKSLEVIREQAGSWTYDQKYDAFRAYFADKSAPAQRGAVLAAVRYGWDVVCDVSDFRQMERQLPAGSTVCQALTPRYGYDIPAEIEEAGLTDELEACFDLSLRLYSQLQTAGYEQQAQYAVLLGHKLRGRASLAGSEAFELFASNSGSPLSRLMLEKLAETHPLLAEMITSTD